jgi:CBS domain-containing protein
MDRAERRMDPQPKADRRMPKASSATPLLALDALALDTETTGLDARKARIIEIALLPIANGRLEERAVYRRLIRPDVAIPPTATRVHGIDAAAVKAAPAFAELWSEIEARIDEMVLIGHAVGFDLAVLEGECRRAGLRWTQPRALDTRLLAQIAAPKLADYALEQLAAWLDVQIAGRHSAAGDAAIAGRVFLALLPRLREAGIRTLGEAERACALLTEAAAGHGAAWIEPGRGTGARNDDLAALSVDSYPYRHRVRDVMSAPAKFASGDELLAAALCRMSNERVSSLFVRFDKDREPAAPTHTGIVTERDVLRALAEGGAAALKARIADVASRPLATVPADALVFLAMARMRRLRVRHLGVADEMGHVVGALSARDLLRLRAEGAVELGDDIEQATDVHGLGRAWAKLPLVVAGLRAENLSGREIAALISHQVQLLSQRAAALAEQRMRQDGKGDPPCAYAFAVLGSAGRGESLLAMDQDNALVFANGEEGSGTDRWFATLAGHATDILNQVGVPHCNGGVMATNPQWRGSVSVWQRRIRAWIEKARAQDLLSVDIFFDLRGVHGDLALAETVWRAGFAAARGQLAFAKLLVETAGSSASAFNLFGGFRTERGRIDLKKAGLFGLVSAARALAICHHVVERSTAARLRGIALTRAREDDLDALMAAQQVLLELCVAQQVEDIARGIPPSNRVEPRRLSRQDQTRLREALKAVGHLDVLTRDLLLV